jgi:hypothetical protein
MPGLTGHLFIFGKKNSKKFCFQKKVFTFAARFGRNDKFIDLLERENEVKKLKAKDSLLIEKEFFWIS